MEIIFAIAIVVLAAAALAVGLMLGRGAPRLGCDGLECVGGSRCHDCPNRKPEAPE